MKTEFQDLYWAMPKVERRFRKNRNASISATFRYLRKHPRFSLIGDYPLLAVIPGVMKSIGVIPDRMRLLYALNSSAELREYSRKLKRLLVDQMVDHFINGTCSN